MNHLFKDIPGETRPYEIESAVWPKYSKEAMDRLTTFSIKQNFSQLFEANTDLCLWKETKIL